MLYILKENIMAQEKSTTQTLLESGWDEDRNGKKWEDYETIICPDGQEIDMVNLLEEQARAQAALVHLAPMFGGFVSKLRFIYTFRIQTQATDGFNLFVNPQFTANLDFTGKCFVMAHEVMHCLLNHMRRGKGHDQMRSNIAADYEVNVTLADIGLFKEATMKKLGAYIDMKYKGYGYEKIYDLCKDSAKDSMNNDGQSGQAGQNSDQNDDSQSGGGQAQSNYSEDFKAGWAQAIADWQAGNIDIE